MNAESNIDLSKPALLKRVAAALMVAALIVATIVLPAEYGLDPTGFGALTGLLAMSQKNETLPASAGPVTAAKSDAATLLAHNEAIPFRTDTIQIPLTAEGADGYELEYKVQMKAGSALVYSWSTTSNVYYDFHGDDGAKPKPRVISYRIEDDAMQSHGSLTAPFDGIHGWYFQNHDVKPIVITLKLSGFYELHEMKP